MVLILQVGEKRKLAASEVQGFHLRELTRVRDDFELDPPRSLLHALCQGHIGTHTASHS